MTVVDHLQAALVVEEHIPRRIPWDCMPAVTAGGGDRPLNWQDLVHNDPLRPKSTQNYLQEPIVSGTYVLNSMWA